jgi:hypothetical protein
MQSPLALSWFIGDVVPSLFVWAMCISEPCFFALLLLLCPGFVLVTVGIQNV